MDYQALINQCNLSLSAGTPFIVYRFPDSDQCEASFDIKPLQKIAGVLNPILSICRFDQTVPRNFELSTSVQCHIPHLSLETSKAVLEDIAHRSTYIELIEATIDTIKKTGFNRNRAIEFYSS